MAEDRIVHLNDANFDDRIKQTSGPVLVDFWADWCGPCKALTPVLEQIAEELRGRAVVAKVDVVENGDLTNRFGIRHIPTLMVFKGGRVVDQMIGAAPREQIRELIEKHIG